MTSDKARESLEVQARFGGGYKRNAVRLIQHQVHHEHGQGAVEKLFGLSAGTDFSNVV